MVDYTEEEFILAPKDREVFEDIKNQVDVPIYREYFKGFKFLPNRSIRRTYHSENQEVVVWMKESARKEIDFTTFSYDGHPEILELLYSERNDTELQKVLNPSDTTIYVLENIEDFKEFVTQNS